MDIYDRTPYTYLIGWSHLNKWYYGVRYAKGCHPSDLWTKYFTSSHIVMQLRIQVGEPDVIQIRRTFSTHKDAILWEYKVLRRLNVIKKEHWVNMNEGRASFSIEKPEGHQKGSKNSMYGRKRPDTILYNKTRIHPLLGKKRPDHSELMKLNNPMKGVSTPFWTNGTVNVRSVECPGAEWRRGFVRKSKLLATSS